MGEIFPISITEETATVSALAPLISEGYATYQELYHGPLTIVDYYELLRLRDWNLHVEYLAKQPSE